VGLRFADTASLTVALSPEPQAIAIPSNPAFAIQIDAAAISPGLPFELIEQHEGVHGLVVDRVTLDVREGCLAIFVRQPGDEGRQVAHSVTGCRMASRWDRLRLLR
jgi:hypothetical protein